MFNRQKPGAFKNAARLRQIVAVFAKYGFQDVAERAKLGRFVLEKFTSPDLEKYSQAERARMALEELGTTFIKLGQVLGQRPDLIPKEYCDEFKKLQDQVPALDFAEVRRVLNQHFGEELESIFLELDPRPLAAASIAQVHRGTLKNGQNIVVKVQRPDIDRLIQEDIGILRTLADLVQRYVHETRIFNPVGVVEELEKSLKQEINFVIEANNIRRFAGNFEDQPDVKIPTVFEELTGRRVLVMEFLDGIPLNQRAALQHAGIDPEEILKKSILCFLRMVFSFGLFHADLHAGNIFVMPNGQIGLVDFGLVGRLNLKTQTALANMLLALADEDYDRLAYLYVDLAPLTVPVDVDKFARELRDLIAPYLGLHNQLSIGKLLVNSSVIAAQYQVQLPSELILVFRALVTFEGMGRVVAKDFDFMSHGLEFIGEIMKTNLQPSRLTKDLSYLTKDMNSLVQILPRQIKQFLRRLNSPDFAVQIHMQELKALRKTLETASNLIFLGLVIGSLIISSSVVYVMEAKSEAVAMPILSLVGYGIAGVLSLVSFYNYIKRN